MRKLIVNEKYNNKKLSNFILDNFKNLSSNTFYKTLRKKDIRINGIKISENITVHTNDIISIYLTDEILYGNSINIDVIYEDNNILVVNKPENISVTEDISSTYTLTTLMKEKFDKNLEPCHRLDRNTSGLVLFAKNKESLDILLKKFKNKEIEKHYLATVYGIPKKEHAILTDYLFKDSKKSLVYISNIPKKNYLEIITEYTLVSKNIQNNTSVLDINLHTGRTHRIRAHLAYIGLPIIGDGKYGNNEINKKFNKKTQMLTSYYLKFNFSTDSGILNYLKNKEIKIS